MYIAVKVNITMVVITVIAVDLFAQLAMRLLAFAISAMIHL
jgi:hypothetical protein